MQKELHISVRNLVEFIFREGDIDNRRKSTSADAMMEGTRIHRKIQKSMGGDYQAEVPLKHTIEREKYLLTLEGRADGIFTENQVVVIDEIKGVYQKLEFLKEPVFVHQAQAMCYAYMVALQSNLPQIGVQMTYCNLDTEEIKRFRLDYAFSELEKWFEDLMEAYQKWADFEILWKERRQDSIQNLEFPFDYRKGQKKLVGDVYRTILRQKNLFIQAPTGVGKTISTVFPAVKAVGEELADRIFYLTAKTITGTVAKESFELLQEQGYQAKIIQLTAKEKMCFCEEMDCNPVQCPYAKGHYDRVNDTVYELLQEENLFTREVLLEAAERHMVCPFEMQLDVSSWCDDIICDYNYAFDPNVYLKRFFQEGIKGDYIFLVDEAHNLVDRSREMYSATLYKEDILLAKRIIKPFSKKMERALDKINKGFLDYKRECQTYQIYDDIGTILFTMQHLASDLNEFLQRELEYEGKKDLTEIYLNLRHFLNIYELVDSHYVIYTQIEEDGRFALKLFCVDPSENLQRCIDKAKSTIYFSATLLPIQYYKNLLSTVEDNYAIYAESTFSQKQRLLLMGKDVSSKYTRRGKAEYQRIASYIKAAISGQKGNYMVFFPSYKMMEDVKEEFLNLLPQQEKMDSSDTLSMMAKESMEGEDDKAKQAMTGFQILTQQPNMREQEREEFLTEFEREREDTLVAFCVMGGIFGEGIDLKEDKLIGAIVVGTGLPQISNEREILKNYYDEWENAGFDYAFRYPGMNKVLQAAGRVIRTTEDKGIIMLLDERFLQRDYDALFPREWNDRKICSLDQVESEVRDFWEG